MKNARSSELKTDSLNTNGKMSYPFQDTSMPVKVAPVINETVKSLLESIKPLLTDFLL